MKVTIQSTQIMGVALLAATLLAGVPAFAQEERGERPERGERTGQANFCEGLSAARAQALARLGEKERSMKRSDKDQERNERKVKHEAKRQDNDTKRSEHYEALAARATTDTQKAAVTEFQNTVEALVETRRASMDAAITTFENGVAALLEERKAAVGTAAGTISDSLEAIFDDAEAACDNGDMPAGVRQVFMSDMQALREEQKGKRSEYDFKDELEALRAERKAAFEAAQTTFKTGLEAAKAELKADFAS